MQHETGDVVGLTSGADEILDTFHQLPKRFLCREARQGTNYVDPARIGKFLSRGVEGFDDAIGEKNQSVARLKDGQCRGESGFRGNAEGQTGGFQALGLPFDGVALENCARRSRNSDDRLRCRIAR